MAQMELDYAQFVVEDDIRYILTTDAKSAFQSASRNNYKVLSTEDTLHAGTFRSILCSRTQGSFGQ